MYSAELQSNHLPPIPCTDVDFENVEEDVITLTCAGLSFHLDPMFLAGAPNRPQKSHQQTTLEQRLRLANVHANGRPISKEPGSAGLRFLRQDGLVTEGQNVGLMELAGTAVLNKSGLDNRLSQYIAAGMNCGFKTGCASPFAFELTARNINIPIPMKCRLILRALAEHFGVDIYLFSSRQRTHLYRSTESRAAIGLYHTRDSFRQLGYYANLTTTRLSTTNPAVPPPPTKRQHIGSGPVFPAKYRQEPR